MPNQTKPENERGFHPGLPFADHLSREALSPSGAKVLLGKSPALYQWSRENPCPETPALLEGSALHALILEGRATYERCFAILPECDGRTTAGKAIKARFQEEAAGKRILTAAQGEKVEAMAAAVFRHPLIPALLEGGTPELSMTWEDSESGAPCKGRLDLARLTDGVIVDLKTALSAAPRDFARSVPNYDYHTQGAAYVSGCKALGAEITDFIFVVCEKTPPHPVAAYRLSDAALELGRRRWQEACALYARCRESGIWPGYGDEIQELTLPNWAMSELYEDSDENDQTHE